MGVFRNITIPYLADFSAGTSGGDWFSTLRSDLSRWWRESEDLNMLMTFETALLRCWASGTLFSLNEITSDIKVKQYIATCVPLLAGVVNFTGGFAYPQIISRQGVLLFRLRRLGHKPWQAWETCIGYRRQRLGSLQSPCNTDVLPRHQYRPDGDCVRVIDSARRLVQSQSVGSSLVKPDIVT